MLAAAAGGDDAAFGVLWRDLQPGLLRYLNAMAPGSGEDLASETWLRVVGGLARFSGDERAFRAWVFTIARHRAVDRWRRRARRNDELVPVDALVDLPAPDDPPARPRGHLQPAAVDLIATLPPDQAEVVLLRVVAGLEVAEVATITGKRPGNVRVLSHRALRRLAERLAEDVRVRGRCNAMATDDVFPAEMPPPVPAEARPTPPSGRLDPDAPRPMPAARPSGGRLGDPGGRGAAPTPTVRPTTTTAGPTT